MTAAPECPESTVEDVLITDELLRRPSRTPDHAAESRALVALAGVMSESPTAVFQSLADAALELCQAGSAGVSVHERTDNGDVFRWRATAGDYTPYLGGTLPRNFSPCGEVVDRDTPLLMSDPVRHYPYIADLCSPVREVLLVPFYQGATAVGTVWVVSHSPDRRFDAEDARLVTSLTRFAGAAVQTLFRIESAERSEKAREETQLRLEATLAAGEVATWTWDVKADRVTADGNLAALFGVSDEDARGGPIARYLIAIHPEDRASTESLIGQAVESGRSFEARYRVLSVDGSYRYVVARGRPQFDADGTVAQLPGVIVDVTRQHRIEQQLRTSEVGRKLALDAAELGSWHVDPATDSLESDDRFQVIFAGVVGPITLEEAFAHIHAEDRERVRTAVAEAMRPDDPAPYEAEYRVVHHDGTICWVFAKGRANFEGEGANRRLVSFDGTIDDVTEEKRVKDELRQLAADLSESGRRKDEFLATLAHELRNPLAPIRNGLTVLRAARTEADREKMVGMMERQVGQLVHLVNDLLDVSRVSTGKVTLRRECVTVRSVIEAAVETNRPLVESGGHSMILGVPERPLFINADPTRMTQVLTNLLNNAAKYTPLGGRIELTASEERGEAVIRVTDSGVGIPAHLLPKVFDMFMQVGASLERSQGGLGLGLTLVRKLVEMHGGTVAAESKGDGQGSTFVVRLPLIGDTRPDSSRSRGAAEISPTVRQRILVVDDNADGAESLAMLLTISGHEVQTAYDGRAGLAAALAFRPTVAILDIGLPGMNGYKLAKRIRETPTLGDSVVLVAMTGWGAEEDRKRAEEAGFEHHMTKPVEPDRLNELIGKISQS